MGLASANNLGVNMQWLLCPKTEFVVANCNIASALLLVLHKTTLKQKDYVDQAKLAGHDREGLASLWFQMLSYTVFKPVEGRVLLQDVHVDVLLNEAVEQDGQRGEADVVQC